MAFKFCLFLIFAYHLLQRYAEAIPIENAVGIPIILAVDPPMASNGTTISPAEQHDFEEILNNSTISAIAADASNSTGTSAELSAPSAAVQMNAASVNTTSSNDGAANNDVPAPERGNVNATKSEATIVDAADSEGGGKTTNGPTSTTTTTTITIGTTAAATEEGAPSAGPLVEIAANPPAAPVPAADTVPKNEAPVPPPAQMSLQAINVPPKNSNSGENLGPSTPRSPSNFAQLPMFEAQQTCTSSDCNGNGNCIGIRGMPLCMCNAGYIGSRCQMEVCDPTEDCNGRGWCVGTKTQFTCFCQLGYSGNECQNENNNGR